MAEPPERVRVPPELYEVVKVEVEGWRKDLRSEYLGCRKSRSGEPTDCLSCEICTRRQNVLPRR